MSKRIGLLTAVFVLAFPAMAGAKIVINKSIAGVNLGEAKAGVRAHLGKPTLDPRFPRDWIYPGRKLLVEFKNGHVDQVFTQNPAQKTAGGIGVGSSIAAVKSHIKGVHCAHVNLPHITGKECLPPPSRHGATEWTTDFHVNPQGRVSSVLVNILPAGGAVDRALARLRF